MKITYIAHPIGGDVKNNIERVLSIIKEINLTEPDVLPFAPYIVDLMALDDNIPEQRQRGIKNNAHLFTCVDELRLYGDRISEGMQEEMSIARDYGIPMTPMTEEIKEILK